MAVPPAAMRASPDAADKSAGRLWAFSALVTVCLHIGVAYWLFQPRETPPQPKLSRPMSVSLVAPPAPPRVEPTPPAPPPPPPPPEKKVTPPPPKPTPPKPVKPPPPKVVKPLVPKPQPKPVAEPPPREVAPVTPPPPVVAPVREAPPPKAEPKPVEEPPVTQASFKADYLHNPKPEYPAAAKQRGWEGTVRLRVKVSASGAAEQVDIQQSSGYDLLDDAALEAVRQWRFVPAKRGDTPIASSVVVPLVFRLPK